MQAHNLQYSSTKAEQIMENETNKACRKLAKKTNACASFAGKLDCMNQVGGKGINGRNALRWI